MTKNEILDVAHKVDRAYPGLRNSDRWEWNHKIAYICYLKDKTVGQKSTMTGPISDDTIGISNTPIEGIAGSIHNVLFLAVDLVNGTTSEIQWLEHGWVSNQSFHVPTPADISNVGNEPIPVPVPPNMVPWVNYNEGSFERLKRMLAHDYARRPQGADFDVSVWAGRFFHNCYMGPDRAPLGEDAALRKIKPELCDALHISLTDPDGTVYYG